MHFAHPQHGGPIWWAWSRKSSRARRHPPALVMARIERRPFRAFGLPAQMPFAATSGWVRCGEIASLTILMLVLRLAGAFESAQSLCAEPTSEIRVYYALFFLLTGFFEEFLVRGYSPVGTLARNVLLAAAALCQLVSARSMRESRLEQSRPDCRRLIGFLLRLTLRRTGTWLVRQSGFPTCLGIGERLLLFGSDSGGMMTGHLLNSSFHGPDWLTGGQWPRRQSARLRRDRALWMYSTGVYPDVKYQV